MFSSYSKYTKAKDAKNTKDSKPEKPPNVFEAIRRGDVEVYQEYVKKSGVGVRTETGESLLTLAAAYNQLEIARHLVSLKHKVNEQDTETWYTPLHHAVKVDAREVIDFLLKQGADVEAKSKENFRPLHTAAQNDRFYPAVTLLQKGAKADAPDLKGFLPIHFAAEGGFQALVELFLGLFKEATGTSKGNATKTKVDYSKFPSVDINVKTDSQWTPLHFASGRGRTELVHFLCNHSAEVNAAGDDGTTPLYFAAEVGATEVVKALLFHKADANLSRKGGMSALFCNAVIGRKEMVEVLIKGGADINATTAQGETALIVASGKGNLDVIKLILTAKADPNMSMFTTGQAAIHKAIKNGHPEVVEELVKNGANFNAVTLVGETPLIVAVKDCHVGLKEILSTLLARKIDVNADDKHGMTALHYATQQGDLELVELLLKHGANINAGNVNQQTPLHLCASSGHNELLTVLANRCKDINAADVIGNTALHLAVMSNHLETMRQLLTLKPRILNNAYGETPIDIAKAHQHENLVGYLQQYNVMQRMEVNMAAVNKASSELENRLKQANAAKEESLVKQLNELKPKVKGLYDKLKKLEHDTSILPAVKPPEDIMARCDEVDEETRSLVRSLKKVGVECAVDVEAKQYNTKYSILPGVGDDTLNFLSELLGDKEFLPLGQKLGFDQDTLVGMEEDAGAEKITAYYLMMAAWRARSEKTENEKVDELKNALDSVGYDELSDLLEHVPEVKEEGEPEEEPAAEPQVKDAQRKQRAPSIPKNEVIQPTAEIKTTAVIIREAVQRNFQELAKQLRAKNLVDTFARKKVLGPYELTRIRSGITDKEGNHQFLSIVLYELSANVWAEQFLQFLQNNQPNLYEKVNQSIQKEKERLTQRGTNTVEVLSPPPV